MFAHYSFEMYFHDNARLTYFEKSFEKFIYIEDIFLLYCDIFFEHIYSFIIYTY